MTNEEFKNLWLRESGPQFGIMLDVTSVGAIDITKSAANDKAA